MKMVESACERRTRQQIDINGMQCGFVKGKGTIDRKTDAGELLE